MYTAYVSFPPNRPYFPTGAGKYGLHQVNILRHILADGKVKVFQDEKGAAERVEIETPKGMVIVYKEYRQAASLSRYTKVEVTSLDNEPVGTIDIVTDVANLLHPVSKFFIGTSMLGQGTGDVAMYVASKFISDVALDTRYIVGSSVDQEVIETIQKMLDRKRG